LLEDLKHNSYKNPTNWLLQFHRFLVENMSFSYFAILNEVNKWCQSFTCFSSMGGVSAVDYLIVDFKYDCNSIFNFFIGDKNLFQITALSSKYIIV
jgi:hypothetical protein